MLELRSRDLGQMPHLPTLYCSWISPFSRKIYTSGLPVVRFQKKKVMFVFARIYSNYWQAFLDRLPNAFWNVSREWWQVACRKGKGFRFPCFPLNKTLSTPATDIVCAANILFRIGAQRSMDVMFSNKARLSGSFFDPFSVKIICVGMLTTFAADACFSAALAFRVVKTSRRLRDRSLSEKRQSRIRNTG